MVAKLYREGVIDYSARSRLDLTCAGKSRDYESSRLPPISATWTLPPTEMDSKLSIYIDQTHSAAITINAPAGYGKSTFIRDFLGPKIYAERKSATILRERIEDVLTTEAYLNDHYEIQN